MVIRHNSPLWSQEGKGEEKEEEGGLRGSGQSASGFGSIGESEELIGKKKGPIISANR